MATINFFIILFNFLDILHDKSKVGNLKIEIGNWKKHKEVDALPNFEFPVSSFDIGIQFDNTRFFEKSVN